MNNYLTIKDIAKDYDIHKFFVRGTLENKQDIFTSSFYIINWDIKRSNLEYKTNGKNYIVTKLDEFIEDEDGAELPDLIRVIKTTIKFNNKLVDLVNNLPNEFKTATYKYQKTNNIDSKTEIEGLYKIADTCIENISKKNFFTEIDQYNKELLALKILIENVIRNNKYDSSDIYNLKNHYEQIRNYLLQYKTDLSQITKEIQMADTLIYSLFQKIRGIGITTCDADIYIDNDRNNKKNTIKFEVELFNDIKYESIYKFKDNSILIKKVDGTLIEIKDNNQLKDIKVEMMLNIIKQNFNKIPVIEHMLKEALINNSNYIYRIMGIAHIYKKYSPVLKDKKFNIVNEMSMYIKTRDEYESLEIIADKMMKIVKKHKVKQFANSIASKKYQKLYNEKVMEVMESLYELKIEQPLLQEYIGVNIAAYKTSDDLYNSLMKMYNHFTNFKKEEIIKTISKVNSKIIYNVDNLLICEINSFKESNALGAESWCISREETYFNSYTKNNAKQYFVYDFTPQIHKSKNLIGVTLINNTIKSACYRNNKAIKNKDENLKEIVNKIRNIT